MKTILVMVMACGMAVVGQTAEVNVGDSEATVLGVLGEPQAYIQAGSFQMLDYERGRVELRDGKVTLVKLVSQDEAIARRQASQRQAEEARRMAELRRQELIAEGLAIFERKKNDPSFLESSASEQTAYWRSFQRSYPDVNVGREYLAALNRLESELALQRQTAEQERKIRELESRVAAAEQRAAEADAYARRRNSYLEVANLYRPAYVVSAPACNVKPVCATPVVRSTCAQPVVQYHSRRRSSGITVSIGSGYSACRPTTSYVTYSTPTYWARSSAFH